MWPPTVYELVWPQGLFGWPPDHMGWLALLLLVKFKTPGWFYSIRYSYQVAHFWGWEYCVEVWWVTRSKSKVSRPLFSLVLVAGDMICFVVKSENLMKISLWSRLCWLQLYTHTDRPGRLLKNVVFLDRMITKSKLFNKDCWLRCSVIKTSNSLPHTKEKNDNIPSHLGKWSIFINIGNNCRVN